MDKLALVIGGTVLLFGGAILAAGIIGLLIYLTECVWVVASDRFRDICKAESLIHEYRKNQEKFLAWLKWKNQEPSMAVVDVKQYEALREQYHDLRENFIDCVCSGTPNLAPYCLNRCEECVDCRGWCKQDSGKCHGFNPAEIII